MKYKIIEILKTFSVKETKQFDSFLLSPFFNESRKLRNLYISLLEFYPYFEPGIMCEEKLSKKINPDLPFNKSTMKTLFFELANNAEEFLRISNFRTKLNLKEDYLREEYFKRKLYKLVDQNIEKTMNQLDSDKEFAFEYLLSRFYVLTDMCNSIQSSKQNSNQDYIRNLLNHLNERGKTLLYLTTNELLIQNNKIHTLKDNYNINLEDNFIYKLFKKIKIEELLEFIISETDEDSCSVIFELRLAYYKAISDFENEELYNKYKKLFIKNIHSLNKEEIYSNFIMLIKYCFRKPIDNESGFDFRKELFSIYKYLLLKKYYVIGVHDNIPIELYRQVLKLSLELKKFKWCLEFIKKYNPYLNPDVRVNMYNYSLAEYYFHKKRFDQAMRYFHKIELSHFLLRVDIRNLMLMTYYELDMFENAISLIDSYKHFLTNTEVLSDTEKRKCRSFINAVHNMIKYKTSVKQGNKNQIRECLKNVMHNKEWILERFKMIDTRYIESA
ncbi:MAG TPA: hypothetical protein PKC91_06690 [Ignavibacteria bacterium]|nr:hypothetical protein [Ignavibacteria bacterium]